MTEFEKIYRQFSAMVFNLALRYTRQMEDAQEITQDVFLNVHAHIEKFRGESEIKTWIYRITINRALDVLKSKKSKKQSPWRFRLNTEQLPPELFKTNEGPLELLENKEALDQLMACIHQLPPDQRDVIMLLKIEACSMQETAEILNRSPKAVESLLHRAKLALKACWHNAKE
ncbi:MAG: RNA polymerase sigma factor [Chitinophagaceae bacterium]|nr:RNA polymerase sigma factor [Chitinophagaceae bacterium]